MKNQDAGNERVQIVNDKKILYVNCASIEDSDFKTVCIDRSNFEDVSAQKVKFKDANLSDLEIENAQLGGAYIHNIGMPPKGHPRYDPAAKQRPLRFENCNLGGSTITDCNLSNIAITDCNLDGMTINGILVDDLLKRYKNK